MNLDEFPLSMFEVECDGSACGSGPAFGWHTHPVQHRSFLGGGYMEPIGRVRVTKGQRTYLPATGEAS